MANYCDNVIRLSGDSEGLSKLYIKLKEKEDGLNLSNYDQLFESVDDVEDWGSKWQMINIDYSEGDDMMFITGDSAWGPAEGLWEKISKDYNLHIELTYSEPGHDFAGKTVWENGDLIDKEEYTYYEHLWYNDNEYFWEEIGGQSECYTLDEIKESIGDVWNLLSDNERLEVEKINSERYVS